MTSSLGRSTPVYNVLKMNAKYVPQVRGRFMQTPTVSYDHAYKRFTRGRPASADQMRWQMCQYGRGPTSGGLTSHSTQRITAHFEGPVNLCNRLHRYRQTYTAAVVQTL